MVKTTTQVSQYRPCRVYETEANSNAHALRKKICVLALGVIFFTCFIPTSAQACTNPVGVAGDVMYNDSEHVMQWCDGTDWVGVGDPPYIPNAVNFDGATDELNDPSWGGPSAITQVTGSFWFKRNSTGSAIVFVSEHPSTSGYFRIRFTSTDDLRIDGRDSTGDALTNHIDSSITISDTDWHHVLFSLDVTDNSMRHMYIDGVDVTSNSSNTDTDYGFGDDTWVGSQSAGTDRFDGDMADFWLETGLYLDLSDADVRAKFIDASGFPVDLGSNGSRPIGTAPDVFLSGDTATWHTNDGTGGGFTENGALTDALTDPGENLGPTAGLVGWWKLDETSGTTAADSADTNDGTMTGGLDASNDNADGVISNSLNFDGTDDRIVVTDPSNLYDTNPFTISGWFSMNKLASSNGNNYELLRRRESGSPFYSWTFFIDDADDTMHLEIRDSGSTNHVLESDSAFSAATWYHFVGTVDASDNAVLYINGTAQADTESLPSAVYNATDTQLMFGSANGTLSNLDGQLDDVRIYDRVLSAAEITDLYNTGRACQNPDGFRGGDTMYNTTDHVPQYCNLREWMPMDVQGGDGGSCPTIGDVCTDGSVYAGVSPDGNNNMYTTPSDQGQAQWNDGEFGAGLTNTMQDCTNSPPGTASTCRTGVDNTYILTITDSDSNDSGFQIHAAAQACYDLVAHGSDDWYLPAQDELDVLEANKVAIGNFNTSGSFPAGRYWSSSERGTNTARYINFSSGTAASANKNNNNSFRCVRKGQPVAECANPTGNEGDIVYNTTHSVLQYCEGDEWIAIGDYN